MDLENLENFFCLEYSPSQQCFHNGSIYQHIKALKGYAECDYTIVAVENQTNKEIVENLVKEKLVVALPNVKTENIDTDNEQARDAIISEVLRYENKRTLYSVISKIVAKNSTVLNNDLFNAGISAETRYFIVSEIKNIISALQETAIKQLTAELNI